MTPNKEYDVGELIPYVQYSGKDRTIEEFTKEDALALLLAHEVIFLNEHHWEKSWPEKARVTTALCVNCNDTFMWGCADAELVTLSDLQDLFDHWDQDHRFGIDVWCCKRRNMMPQKAVEIAINKDGYWNLSSMNLQPNPYEKHTL